MGRFFDTVSLAAVLVVGLLLTAFAQARPGTFVLISGWVALLAYASTVGVVTMVLRDRGVVTDGRAPMAAGLLLWILSAVAMLFPAAGSAMSSWLAGERLPSSVLPPLLQATGAVGVGLGFLTWAHGLVARCTRAEQNVEDREERNSELLRTLCTREEQLRAALTVDPQTGLLNRAGFLRRLDETILRDARLRKPLAFLLTEVDDTGHGGPPNGGAMKQLAHALQASTRGTDSVGRIGERQLAAVLGECRDPGPAVNRLVLALDGRSRSSAERSFHLRVGTVLVEEPGRGVEMPELFRLAEDALASLRGARGRVWAKRTHTPSTRPEGGLPALPAKDEVQQEGQQQRDQNRGGDGKNEREAVLPDHHVAG